MMPLDSGVSPSPSARLFLTRRWAFRLMALAAAIGLVAGLASCGAPRQPAKPSADSFETAVLRPSLFRKWPKPDLALLLSGSIHGYLLPCGCSHPQVGGVERRYNFVQILKQKGWPIVALDVGDVPQKEGPVKLPNHQGLLKYSYAMKAMKLMGYTAVGIGEYEANLSLFNVLGEWALNEPSPRILVANLKDAANKFPEQTKPWELAKVEGSDISVGVAGLVGRTVAKRIKRKDPSIAFTASGSALQAVLKEMDLAKVDLRVLLYQGSQRLPYERDTDEPEQNVGAEAVECAKAFPQFDVILCLNEEDEPSAEPVWVPDAKAARKTLVVALGHKGKYVGVVGVNRTPAADQPFELRYQLVEMSESLQTPKEREADQPIVKLMEEYTRELRNNKYLARYGQMRHSLQVAVKGVTPTYIGSAKCKKCHDSAYEIWQNTPHSHAYRTLVDAKHPSNRQYDAECIVCHTVGFGYQSGFTDADKTPQLENVGCESCHGPGSEHAANPKDPQWQTLMNAWKAAEDEKPEAKAKRLERIDIFCTTCHDIDNDVTWTDNAFPRKWKKIAHPTVPE
jgi:2',3'-cyclic-nucleotide 2'-phosphodiesterase (5'-nucleotidase family)